MKGNVVKKQYFLPHCLFLRISNLEDITKKGELLFEILLFSNNMNTYLEVKRTSTRLFFALHSGVSFSGQIGCSEP